MKQKYVGLTGNEAVATAFRQARPHVAPAFPITPQTEMMHKFADFVADGRVDTEMVLVESEHSAMSAAIGSAATGARTFTATSSAGFALMWEVVYIAASLRLPICMPVVNRALSGNINIHNDHSDTMGGRDAGWIQLFCENAQEAYDTALMCWRIAEHADVRIPVMINYDGFIISHTAESLHILEDDDAWKFIGPKDLKTGYSLLDVEKPITVGPLDLTDYYFEHKVSQMEALNRAPKTIKKVFDEFGKLSGRQYDFLEEYRTEDAELIIVAIGSTCGTAKDVIDAQREKGVKVGLVKIRMFRPFPAETIAKALGKAKVVGVMDKSASFGAHGGPLFMEIRSALYGKAKAPKIHNWIYGLGGRDTDTTQIEDLIAQLQAIAGGQKSEDVNLLGVRL
ncbi:pyruvate ferredoxin oxidoreductase [bacterium]|nr:pyruvate ferredoxin oxidoreductase [bacterium]